MISFDFLMKDLGTRPRTYNKGTATSGFEEWASFAEDCTMTVPCLVAAFDGKV